jgi:hypothetical protein
MIKLPCGGEYEKETLPFEKGQFFCSKGCRHPIVDALHAGIAAAEIASARPVERIKTMLLIAAAATGLVVISQIVWSWLFPRAVESGMIFSAFLDARLGYELGGVAFYALLLIVIAGFYYLLDRDSSGKEG